MRHSTPLPAVRPLVALAMALGSAGCCGERPGVVCPMSKAASIAVIDATGNAIQGAFVRVSGPVLGSFCLPSSDGGACDVACAEGHCVVWGHSGTYEFEATAPGFLRKRISVDVRDTSGRCDPCESVAPANIRIALIRS